MLHSGNLPSEDTVLRGNSSILGNILSFIKEVTIKGTGSIILQISKVSFLEIMCSNF
jgi:hypothetical protein